MTPVQLTTPVESLPGLSPRQAAGLRSLNITNLGRLVAYLPLRHERIEAEAPIADLAPDQNASARGQITATRIVRAGRPRIEAVLHDGTGRLDLVWFNMLFLRERILPGVRLRVQGKTKLRGGGLQMANPKWEVLRPGEEEPPEQDEHMRAVYPATEEFKSGQIAAAIRAAAAPAFPLIEDHLPEAFRRERHLPDLREAYRMQHFAAEEAQVLVSRRRLAYDELLMLQLGVHMKRAHLRDTLRAPALKWNAAIDRHIRDRLPFTLTPGQDAAVREIAADLSRVTPANRLLQGDVGSGKTVVALYAMLMAVASGLQASLMAPTEILAEQHFASVGAMLDGSRVRVELLTGATPRDERAGMLARLAAGEVDILIGTHALLTESVRFKDLAIAIIDEQHRFGVVQRAGLREKASDDRSTPHVLVMTATPIPRTLAITLFGDLDISTVTGLPPGRRPIKTLTLTSENRALVYDEVSARINLGQQAFVVVPAIDASGPLPDLSGAAEPKDAPPLRDVRTVADELQRLHLPGRRIGVMHGQLSRASRENVMDRFRRREIDVLVATTVIEVGVDVPNATVMVVEQADRFGLAQLHQLRGRVGRGAADSLCYLIADPATDEARERLKAIARTADGFELAEKDLEIRGPGEVFGSRQSGLPPFKVADLTRDRDLLGMARRDAAAWIARSPRLDRPEEQLLLRRTLKAFGEHLGLADVG